VTRARRLRALALWGALAVGIAGAVVWRARAVQAYLEDEVARNYSVTTRALSVAIVAWGQARAAHAEAAAELLAADAAFAAGPPRGGGRAAPAARRLEARFARTMAALAARDMFVGGWVLDSARRVLARATPAGVAPGAAPAPGHPSGARTVPCGPRFCVEFAAPVRPAGPTGAARAAVGTVVLLAAVDDSTFRPLNPMRPHVRTGRTTVLARPAGPGDTLVVVASAGARESPRPAGRRPAAAAPPHVRRALAAAPGVVATGLGPALHGAPALYGVARMPELDWVVLRELDHAEVRARTRDALVVEQPVLVTLLLAVVALVRHRLRAGRARRTQELTRLRADFVAGTSHELRTPLAQIRLFAELLQKGTLRGPEESARALRIIEKEASRLTILVDNLLNYTRLRRRAADAAAAAAAPTLVADEVAHVIEAFAPLAAERGARVVAAVPAGLSARVDSLALRQVLTNYLENAVKYGPPGQTVTVGASADGRRVRLWVDDQGGGVPRDERATVWEPFRRGRGAEASAQGGSGIGLAVVRELALEYGGDVGAEDAPGGGARFVVCFPGADRRAGEHLDERPGR
jgi:signal transduction histidine kinase